MNVVIRTRGKEESFEDVGAIIDTTHNYVFRFRCGSSDLVRSKASTTILGVYQE